MRVAALVLTVVAFAPTAGAADWYGEFHAGTTRATDAGGSERVEGAYGIGVGVEFNRWFSTQLDWHTLGENSPPPSCAPLLCVSVLYPEHGYALRALPRLPLGEDLALELGIGFMAWEGDVTDSGVVFSDSGTDPFYSFGASWKFGESWSATVEYQQLQHDFLDFDWTGATLRYRF